MPLHLRLGGGACFPSEAVQCLDVVLRNSMALKPQADVAAFKSGFFISDPRHCHSIGGGAEVTKLQPDAHKLLIVFAYRKALWGFVVPDSDLALGGTDVTLITCPQMMPRLPCSIS